MAAPASPQVRRLPSTRIDPLVVAAMLAAATAVLQLSQLPSPWLSWVLAVAGALWLYRAPRWHWLGWALLAAAWTLGQAQAALDVRLPANPASHDARLQLRIEGLPERGSEVSRFDARVLADEPGGAIGAGRRLRLAWYRDAPDLQPGEVWQLDLRLRAPRGVVNPGGFDFERYAVQRGLSATGYVRSSATARRLAPAGGIDAWRAQIAAAIDRAAPASSARFLRGLAVGDTRALSDADWDTLRATGLSHLLAISGLHIGLVAGFGAWMMRGLYAVWPRLAERWPRPLACALAALLFAAGYSALAGFGLPTLRTLVMIAAALLGVLLRRRVGGAQALALAALAMLVLDPLALLGAGFWLSFLGVGWLLLCLPAETGLRAAAHSLWWAQWAMALGLLPLTIAFFGQSSLVGVLLNLFAVPWVNLLVVPLTLLGTLALPWPALAALPLAAAGAAMDLLWWAAEASAAWPWAQVYWPQPAAWAVVLALLGCGVLLLPRGLPGKPLAALLMLPLLWPAREAIDAGGLRVDVLDVGQGTAVLVRTQRHALLVDAGPAYRGGLDLGEAAVLPALRALAVRRLDRLLISHGDNDHAGGAAAVRRAFPAAAFASGEPDRLHAAPCRSGQHWRWDGVDFRVLHPPALFPELGNDSSCVLAIAGAGASVLLPGDISADVEQRLLRANALARATLLVVPHHGSRSASSGEFVAAVRPLLALFSRGHGNRFGHPHDEVRQRYRDAGSLLLDSAADGAVAVQFAADGGWSLRRERRDAPRWWRLP